ncbi:Bug family tripartite tricarboxylate transporter substrate binding protein [Natronococcus jeotgali]|nr:tripartite tricarboxylate transporter substrate-binding protein [Natronococcus jeotgali]
MPRRRAVIQSTGAGIGSLLLAGCLGGGNGNDDFPSQQFHAIIPWGQGGGTDIFTREIWQEIADQGDVSVGFENITGAAGVRGISELYSTDPDGYTISPMNSPSVVPLLTQDPGFTIDEFRHVGAYTQTVWVLVTDPNLDLNDFEEVASAYDAGDIEAIAGQSPGEPNHVLAESLRSELGIPWESYVAYDGSGPIIQAVAAGEVPAGIVTETAAADAEDQINVLTALSSEGSPVFPDLPVYTDYGYDAEIDFMGQFLRSFMAPPDTPDERIEILNKSLQEALESDTLQSWADDTGNHLEYLGGEDEVLKVLEENQERIPEIIDLNDIE